MTAPLTNAPASHLVSRPCGIGYNALAVLVLVMMLPYARPPFELICPVRASVQVRVSLLSVKAKNKVESSVYCTLRPTIC